MKFEREDRNPTQLAIQRRENTKQAANTRTAGDYRDAGGEYRALSVWQRASQLCCHVDSGRLSDPLAETAASRSSGSEGQSRRQSPSSEAHEAAAGWPARARAPVIGFRLGSSGSAAEPMSRVAAAPGHSQRVERAYRDRTVCHGSNRSTLCGSW